MPTTTEPTVIDLTAQWSSGKRADVARAVLNSTRSASLAAKLAMAMIEELDEGEADKFALALEMAEEFSV